MVKKVKEPPDHQQIGLKKGNSRKLDLAWAYMEQKTMEERSKVKKKKEERNEIIRKEEEKQLCEEEKVREKEQEETKLAKVRGKLHLPTLQARRLGVSEGALGPQPGTGLGS